MVRTQVQFDEQQYEQIRWLAHGRRISVAEAVRRLVTRGLRAGPGEDDGRRGEALLEIAGIGASGLGDLARSHDDYLAAQAGASGRRRPRRGRR
jgi:hypothetical protein